MVKVIVSGHVGERIRDAHVRLARKPPQEGNYRRTVAVVVRAESVVIVARSDSVVYGPVNWIVVEQSGVGDVSESRGSITSQRNPCNISAIVLTDISSPSRIVRRVIGCGCDIGEGTALVVIIRIIIKFGSISFKSNCV